MAWHIYLMGFAAHAATKSKDPTKVGAALVGPEREVRLTAFNGPPRGVQDLPERFERPAKYRFASHAESNLVAFAAREGIRTAGCTVYTTHFPCSACARALIQAGIVCVVAGPGTTSMPAEEFEAARAMFAEAGVQAVRLACAPVIQNVPGTDGKDFPDWGNSFPDPANEGGTGSRQELEAELRVLRAQRMGPERERELLEANNRLLERARAAEGRLRQFGVDARGAA